MRSGLRFRLGLIDFGYMRAQKHDLHACMPHCHRSARMLHRHISIRHYISATAHPRHLSSCMPSHASTTHILNTSHHMRCSSVCCVQPIIGARFRGNQELRLMTEAHTGAVSRFVDSSSMGLHNPHIDIDHCALFCLLQRCNETRSTVQFIWGNT